MRKFVKEVTDVAFEELVLMSDLPVLVDFWAQGCAPCEALAPVLEKYAEQFSGRIAFVKLEIDWNFRAVADRYNIRSVPTLILFHHGQEICRSSGIGTTTDRFLEKYLRDFA